MSRAFVKEQDGAPELLPERPVSAAPNYVTPRGLSLIEAEIARLRHDLAQAQEPRDPAASARLSRDLRYWEQRRATAQLVAASERTEKVSFGCRVAIERSDGRRQSFTIVGEDEADPGSGLIAYTAPIARAVIGKRIGDVADVPGGEAEILSIA